MSKKQTNKKKESKSLSMYLYRKSLQAGTGHCTHVTIFKATRWRAST